HVLGGVIKPGSPVMRTDGVYVGSIKGIQERSESISEAKYHAEVAVAIEGPTVGRQIKEGDVLLVDIPERHAKLVEQELYDTLSPDAIEAFNKFLEIKRKDDPFWGL
ncbi:MAG: translation initiation factor IF-2, partial [Methanosarcinales archaeon]|nr:translation initiation factor IF-2 [Methanosarcinales archaeon]